MSDHPGTPQDFGPGWSERVMEHARPYIVRGPHASWVFWPSHAVGSWNAAALRLIVDELERRDREEADRG